jgi:hypothetical protein
MNKKALYFDFVFKNKARGKANPSASTFPALEIAVKETPEKSNRLTIYDTKRKVTKTRR